MPRGFDDGQPLVKIVSGGQTGVDIAALNVAISRGMPYGGYVPKGRMNEAGRIPDRYKGLIETPSDDVAHRTRMNVLSSDATLIFTDGAKSDGTARTEDFAKTLSKPCHVADTRLGTEACVRRLRSWLGKTSIAVLNVAGPRASEAPGLEAQVTDILNRCFDAADHA